MIHLYDSVYLETSDNIDSSNIKLSLFLNSEFKTYLGFSYNTVEEMLKDMSIRNASEYSYKFLSFN